MCEEHGVFIVAHESVFLDRMWWQSVTYVLLELQILYKTMSITAY